jgi:hypothetical protein
VILIQTIVEICVEISCILSTVIDDGGTNAVTSLVSA